jgi:hypothetical protein
MIEGAKRNFPQGKFFVADGIKPGLRAEFDFIILSDILGNLSDIQKGLEEARALCGEKTRVIITYYNFIWEPIFRMAEKLKLKMPQPLQSWVSYDDVNSFLSLSGLEAVQRGRMIIFPKNIPLISDFVNRFLAKLPILKHLCITQYWVGKLDPKHSKRKQNYSVSIIVPARNEKGNIENIVTSIPEIGSSTEIVFVEGGSTDGTYEEIEKAVQKHYARKIKLIRQDGIGKADAVYKGMDNASGEILMILDADLTVSPDELEKFYQAMTESNADLAIGSRLVYPMEKKAMRFLNLLGNKAFGLTMSWLVERRIKDTLCGTKVLFKDRYEKLKEKSSDIKNLDPFGDFFFILGAARDLCKIVEIPIRYKERTYGTTNISRFKHGFYLFKMCLVAAMKIKFR